MSLRTRVRMQVDKPWPVDVMDHQGTWHSIPLVPGEMALYEGASCPHGREVSLLLHVTQT